MTREQCFRDTAGDDYSYAVNIGDYTQNSEELEVRVSAPHFLQPGHDLLLYDYL